MDIHGTMVTITETFDAEAVEEQLCPYDIHGRIEPLEEGTYTVKVIFVDKYLNVTKTLHEATVSFEVIPD